MGYETTPLAATEYHSFFFFAPPASAHLGRPAGCHPSQEEHLRKLGGKEKKREYMHMCAYLGVHVCVLQVYVYTPHHA